MNPMQTAARVISNTLDSFFKESYGSFEETSTGDLVLSLTHRLAALKQHCIVNVESKVRDAVLEHPLLKNIEPVSGYKPELFEVMVSTTPSDAMATFIANANMSTSLEHVVHVQQQLYFETETAALAKFYVAQQNGDRQKAVANLRLEIADLVLSGSSAARKDRQWFEAITRHIEAESYAATHIDVAP